MNGFHLKQVFAVLVLNAFQIILVYGQTSKLELGPVVGVSSSMLDFQTVRFFGGTDTFITASEESHGFGWFAGVYTKYSPTNVNIFLQSQLDLNISRIKIRYDDDHFGTVITNTEQETVSNLGLAVSMGYDLGKVSLQAGPKFVYLLTDKLTVYHFEQDLKNFNWGFGVGIGIGLGSFRTALEYYYYEPNIGDLVSFQNTMLGFNASQHNATLSIQKNFLK